MANRSWHLLARRSKEITRRYTIPHHCVPYASSIFTARVTDYIMPGCISSTRIRALAGSLVASRSSHPITCEFLGDVGLRRPALPDGGRSSARADRQSACDTRSGRRGEQSPCSQRGACGARANAPMVHQTRSIDVHQRPSAYISVHQSRCGMSVHRRCTKRAPTMHLKRSHP
jgi:hypothetical protein